MSLVRSLFLGNAPIASFSPFPTPDAETQATTEEIAEMVGAWAADNIDAAAIDAGKEIPRAVIDGLGELGLLGLIVPEQYGGVGMGQYAYSRVMEAVAHRCASTVTVIGGHMGLCMKPVLLFGTDEQKTKWLPGFASGETIGSFALTEAGAGSDAGGLRTNAVAMDDGSWKLSGTKVMITNAAFADVFAVFARTPDPENPDALLLERPISCFYVRASAEGVTVSTEEDKMGLCGSSTCEVAFDEVAVPADDLIGTRGEGFKIALNTLNTGRHGLAACCIGQAKLATELAFVQATERVQFGKSIAEFGLVQEMLAGMRADVYGMEAGTHLAAGLIDRGESDYLLESACCKIYATERLWTLANDALQVAGGMGFMREYPFERIVRDARINLIFEGTNQILRTLIAGQGLRPLFREMDTDTSPTATPSDFAPVLKLEAERALELTAALGARTTALAKKNARALLGDQSTQARLSETAVGLYTAFAILSKATTELAAEQDQTKHSQLTDLARLSARRRLAGATSALARLDDPDTELEQRVVKSAIA
jgi:acyl-CoA dehydrogenase family protein 9